MRLIPLRPIEVPWQCRREGDCCTKPAGIVMTPAELDVLRQARPQVPVAFLMRPDGWIWLRTKPCPFFARDAQGTGGCTVYAARPFNCRRFICGRSHAEAWQEDAEGVCLNLEDRLKQSRPFRRFYALIQRRAQRWARAHGWSDDVPRTAG